MKRAAAYLTAYTLAASHAMAAPFGTQLPWVKPPTLSWLSLSDFGAACDGTTIDTNAIQKWLNAASPYVKLIAPPGTCIFDAPLTTPIAGGYTIEGAGAWTTFFKYVGSNTTNNLLSIGGGTAIVGVTLSNFAIVSATRMTGGVAISIDNSADMTIANVRVDSVNSLDNSTKGNLCGGIRFVDSSAAIIVNPWTYSIQNCGDGLEWHSTGSGQNAELMLIGGEIGGEKNSSTNVVSGFINGVHLSGGVGGFRCVSTNIANNLVGLLVNRSGNASTANRELNQDSSCAIDSNQNQGIRINDPDDTGPFDLAGWIASTQQGPGIDIEQVASGATIQIRGDVVYNNCGDGLYNNSTNANFFFSSSVAFRQNGANLGSGCATWQAGAGAGTGYGIDAAATPATATGAPSFISNVTGTLHGVWPGLGVSCSGSPTASFASTHGIVTHC